MTAERDRQAEGEGHADAPEPRDRASDGDEAAHVRRAHPVTGRATPVKDAQAMIAGMAPARRPGVHAFCAEDGPGDLERALPRAIGFFAETEGPSVILEVADAEALGMGVSLPIACLTLRVHSALDGVGLTAAVAGVLAEEGIPCNMVAAGRHDHVFVPVEDADRALAALRALAPGAARVSAG